MVNSFQHADMLYMTLDHKTIKPRHKSHDYIYRNIKQYIVWVKIIIFYFMPKINRISSKDYDPLRYLVHFLP